MALGEEEIKVLQAVCELWKEHNGEPSCIGRVIQETKFNEGHCKSIVEQLVENGLLTRVVKVDMNNRKRYCYKPSDCGVACGKGL